MKRIALMAVVLAVVSAAGAHAETFATSVDRGEAPRASAVDFYIANPRLLKFVVNARPAAPVRVDVHVSCWRGSKSRQLIRKWIVKPPVRRRVRLPVRRPEYCSFAVQGIYADADQGGRIAVALRGRAGR